MKKVLLLLSASLFLAFHTNSAFSQDKDALLVSSSAGYAEQEEERDIPPPLPPSSSKPIKPSPSMPASSRAISPISSPHPLLSSSTLIGVEVKNVEGEKMGKIRELMIDPHRGQLMYAVVDSVASFGMGKQKSFAVPWQALQVNLDQTEIVVQRDRGLLPGIPSVALNKQ